MYRATPDPPDEAREVEVGLRHVVPLVVALCVVIWVVAATFVDRFAIALIAMMLAPVPAVLIVKGLMDEGWRERAAVDARERRQHLTALVVAVVLPIAVVVATISTHAWGSSAADGGAGATCERAVQAYLETGIFTDEQARLAVADADPDCG